MLIKRLSKSSEEVHQKSKLARICAEKSFSEEIVLEKLSKVINI
jgi:hypothetical protein